MTSVLLSDHAGPLTKHRLRGPGAEPLLFIDSAFYSVAMEDRVLFFASLYNNATYPAKPMSVRLKIFNDEGEKVADLDATPFAPLLPVNPGETIGVRAAWIGGKEMRYARDLEWSAESFEAAPRAVEPRLRVQVDDLSLEGQSLSLAGSVVNSAHSRQAFTVYLLVFSEDGRVLVQDFTPVGRPARVEPEASAPFVFEEQLSTLPSGTLQYYLEAVPE